MKKSFATDAINIKSYPLNDNDSIVVMFSKTKGLIHAIAKGAKTPKSKLGARIQMFIANRLMLYEGKNLDTIAQAQSLNTFSKIRYDLNKISYAMYISELVNNFCSNQLNKDENTNEIYDLIYSVYEKIAESNTTEEILFYTLKFQLKLMNISGWGLDFEYCSKCQKILPDDMTKSSVFSYSIGGFICPDCVDRQDGAINIHNKIRLFLNELSKTSFLEKTKYDDKVNMFVLEKCFTFIKKYIDNLTNKKTKVFEVLDKIKI